MEHSFSGYSKHLLLVSPFFWRNEYFFIKSEIEACICPNNITLMQIKEYPK